MRNQNGTLRESVVKRIVESVDVHEDSALLHDDSQLLQQALVDNASYVKVASAVVSLLGMTLLVFVEQLRDIPETTYLAMAVLTALFSLFPLAIQVLPRVHRYSLTLAWVALLGAVIAAQMVNFLFGAEQSVITKIGWPPLLTLAIPLFLITSRTFLLGRHALAFQLMFLVTLAIASLIKLAVFWDEFETPYGIGYLLITIVIIGPLIMLLNTAQIRIQGEVNEQAAIRVHEEANAFKARQLAEVERFVLAYATPDLCLPAATVASHSESPFPISGDFIFQAQGSAGELNFAVCDAMGHGAGAGMLTVLARTVLQSITLDEGPQVWGNRIHQTIVALDSTGFITGAFGKLYPDGRLQIANFGHPPSLIIRAADQSVTRLPSANFAMGLFDASPGDVVYSDTLEPGDMLVLMTDGFPEARAADGAGLLGEDGLKEAYRLAPQDPHGFIYHAFDQAYEHVGTRGFDDDVSLFAILRNRR